MANQCIVQTPSAYGFPLLIKGLLESGVTRAPEQEIVSADSARLRSPQLGCRARRYGGNHGWDTNRYLEFFFAVPMMGAVLHTVNVRLSAEHILYTINQAEDDVILINSEFSSAPAADLGSGRRRKKASSF
jgi:fatty-acyl-CoA synthase